MGAIHRTATATWLTLAAALGGCGPDVGDGDVGAIKVTVSTTGASVDPDGYTIAVGDQPADPIGTSGEKQITDLQRGAYPVRLGGLASNCYVEELNPMSVQVAVGSVSTAAFHVVCTVAGASVRATILTTGPDQDPDGYLLKVGTATPQRIPVTGLVNLGVREEGQLPLELSGLAANCTADPSNPTSVTASQGVATPITLKVGCTVSTGAIRFTVVPSGEDVQKGDFRVYLNNNAIAIGATGVALVARLTPGAQGVYLDEYSMTPNCVPTGDNPRTVTVEFGDTLEVELGIACTRLPHFTIAVTTTGEDAGTGGYELELYASDYYRGVYSYQASLPANGSVVSPAVQPGAYTMQLHGVAANCRLMAGPANPTTISTEDVAIQLVVECHRIPGAP